MDGTRSISAVVAISIVAVLLGLTPTAQSEPPNVCTYKPLKVKVIRGMIVSVGSRDPIADARVIVRKGSYDGEIIAETTTDARGQFSFPKMPSGKYYMTAEAKFFRQFLAEVHVSRFRFARTGIVLGLSMASNGMGCFESSETRTLPP